MLTSIRPSPSMQEPSDQPAVAFCNNTEVELLLLLSCACIQNVRRSFRLLKAFKGVRCMPFNAVNAEDNAVSYVKHLSHTGQNLCTESESSAICWGALASSHASVHGHGSIFFFLNNTANAVSCSIYPILHKSFPK